MWVSIEAARGFSYSGAHQAAMRQSKGWLAPTGLPTYVLWWREGPEPPEWEEAVARYERLVADGPTAEAFSFAHPFGPDRAKLAR